MKTPYACACLVLASLLVVASAAAAPQRWPFLFDPNIAADPAGTQQQITQGEATLPDLPVSSLQTMQSGAVTLWLWPESAALLNRAAVAGPGLASWPVIPALCKAHDALVVPALLLPGAGTSCTDADSAIRQQLADLGACDSVEQPERYALAYKPTEARQHTNSIEDMFGLAGEGLSHPPLPSGLLPDNFVPAMRAVLDKVRRDKLLARLDGARAAYAQATKLANDNAACFDPAARASLLSALASLGGELDAARAWLDKLDSEGKAAHAHEDLCLAARSRARIALPFPSLTAAERKLIAFWLGGIYWRMRGGGLIPLGSTQDARIYFLLQPFTQIGQVAGGQDGADAAFQIYLKIFEGWSDWQDMGNTPGGGDKYADLVGMTSRGKRQVDGAVQLLGQRSYDTLALGTGGLHMGPCYYYAYYPLQYVRYADQLAAPYSPFIEWPTAIGEFCSGASIALGFAETLLDGKATGQPPTVSLCSGRSCGDDGCGGSCGSCVAGSSCSASGQCVGPACTPKCDGAVCGDDGCGKSCGSCGAGTSCQAGQCAPADGAPAGGDAGVGGNGDTPAGPGGAHGCGCSTVPRDDERGPWVVLIAAAALAIGARASRGRPRRRSR